ncbi:TonB-dependent receptor [Novosphingobium sp. PhB165]|uniref:TonB-dependent receptor n=1 Tax=Novosphingobium sp. PhB165 TaxID=2485105 RepID=UPI001FB553A7|nr:TonB-dependent receptor [Novosphingobium sp. PhB165]
MAQQAPSQDAEEASSVIIVEARRRDESIQDVPMAVNAVTSEQIQKLNMRDFNEVQNLVPGLQFFSNSNGVAAGGQMRGIQYDPNAGVSASVAFYQNDAPQEGSLVLQTMYDVSQVEVLRGPQGTLRGQATPSGSIVVNTKRPDLYNVGGYMSTTANTIGGQNVNGALNLPLLSGLAAVRVAGVYSAGEGNRVTSIQNDGDRRDPYTHTASGRISLLVEPTDFLRLYGVAQTMSRKAREFDQFASYSLFDPSAEQSDPVITPGDRLSILSNPRNVDQTFNSYNWRAELRLAGQLLVYQGQKYDLDVQSVTNSDSANILSGKNWFQTTHTHADTWTHEIRLQNESLVAGMFDYVAGYFHTLQKADTNVISQTPVFLPASLGGGLATIAETPIGLNGGHVTEESFFANLTAHIGDSTELSGGLRHIKHRDPGVPMVIAGNALPTSPVNDDGMIYIASLKHRFSPAVMAYASFGTSRRPGAFSIGDFSVVKSDLQNSFQNLKTETSQSYEAGIKTTLFGGRGTANLSVYHQKFNNYPYRSQSGVYYVNYMATVGAGGAVTVTPSVGIFNFVASVPVEVNGVEADASFEITPNWSVSATASYALGKIKNGLIPCNDLNGDGIPDDLSAPPSLAALQAAVGANNVAGCKVTQRSSFQSPFSATVQTEYHQDISSSLEGFGRAMFNFNGSAQGDPQFAFDQVGSYGLLNLFLGIRDPKGAWEVSAFAKNLFGVDKATIINRAATSNYQQLVLPTFKTVGMTATSPYTIINTTPNREFGLTFRYAFGSR